jgi:hypothetical protein
MRKKEQRFLKVGLEYSVNLLIVFSVHTKFVKISQENSTSILYNIQKFYFQTSFLVDPSI